MSAITAVLEWARQRLKADAGFAGVAVEAVVGPVEAVRPMVLLQVESERPVGVTGARELRSDAQLRLTIIAQTLKAAGALERAASRALVRPDDRREAPLAGGWRILSAVRRSSSQVPESQAGQPVAVLAVAYTVRLQEEE